MPFKDKDKLRAYQRKWESENRDKLRAQRKAKYPLYDNRRDKEKIKLQRRARYVANQEKMRAEKRRYVATHKLERKEYRKRRAVLLRKHNSKRRAMRINAFVEFVDPAIVFDRDKGVCGICKRTVDPMSKWHIDHIIPLSKGGAESYDNVQLAHQFCNLSKRDRLQNIQPTLFQVVA